MDNCLLHPENGIGIVYVNYVGQAIKKVYFFTEKRKICVFYTSVWHVLDINFLWPGSCSAVWYRSEWMCIMKVSQRSFLTWKWSFWTKNVHFWLKMFILAIFFNFESFFMNGIVFRRPKLVDYNRNLLSTKKKLKKN